ncbi:MAG: capsular polysaccharide biosynthesis protein [Alphaproteobacteria bacterium]
MPPVLSPLVRPETYGLGPDARLGVLSLGIMRQRKILSPFLAPWGRMVYWPGPLAGRGRPDALLGWGTKGRARMEAVRRGLPYLALEDGFLRSLGLPHGRDRLLSLVVDPVGIYYDAERPSALECLIAATAEAGCPDLEETRAFITQMVGAQLGKFNSGCGMAEMQMPEDRSLIVLADQIRQDQSIERGGATAETFFQMVETARTEHPDAHIVLKTHPKDGDRGRTGHLAAHAHRLGLKVVDAGTPFMALARRAARVYTVTSHAGFEALMAGAPVTCFGTPFYAGWGLTDDRRLCPRRTARASLETLVWAAYFAYPSYRDPIFDRPCTVQTAVRLATRARTHRADTAAPAIILGLGNGKIGQVRPFLDSAAGRARTDRTARSTLLRARQQNRRVVLWASRHTDALAAQIRALDLDLVYAEDGFLRSVGLGRHLAAPASLVFDRTGIYYDCRCPSDLETLLETGTFNADLLGRVRMVLSQIRTLGLSKYNCGRSGHVGSIHRQADDRQTDRRRRILVPGQVEQDASIRCSSPQVNTNLALLARVRRDHPDAFIAYKPHPDIEFGRRARSLHADAVLAHADVILDRMDPASALHEADEVHTMTSQMGFEALILGLTVETYGGPFYAGWGLTRDHMTFPRRTRTLTLEQLVAGALILYPRYVDPFTGIPCDVEDVIERLVLERLKRPSGSTALARLLLDLWWTLRPTPP